MFTSSSGTVFIGLYSSTKACDMCRKKKIKCDGKLPACTHCINYKTECLFTQVEKKRNPPKGYEESSICLRTFPLTQLYRAKYIEGLENRLGRMENLLRLSGTYYIQPFASVFTIALPLVPFWTGH